MIITKREFAARCGVSTPTVYSWIKKNRDGLTQFITPDGIDAAIFDAEPWRAYKDNVQPQRHSKQEDGETGRALAEAAAQIDSLTATVNQQREVIALLTGQIATKDKQIAELHVLLDRQLKALPPPRKTFLEWIGLKKKEPTGADT